MAESARLAFHRSSIGPSDAAVSTAFRGARRATDLVSVVSDGLKLAADGIVLGLVATIPLSQVLESQLFGVSPRDPATLAVTSLLLLVLTAVACFWPARRASRVDPTVALRYE